MKVVALLPVHSPPAGANLHKSSCRETIIILAHLVVGRPFRAWFVRAGHARYGSANGGRRRRRPRPAAAIRVSVRWSSRAGPGRAVICTREADL